jgi:hypothetical protein
MNNIDVALLKTIPEVCPVFQARATARAITLLQRLLKTVWSDRRGSVFWLGSEVHPMKPLQNWPQGRG